MADIKLTVDTSDVVKGINASQRFERNINKLNKAYKSGSITQSQYQRGLNQQARDLSKLSGSYRQHLGQVQRYAAGLRAAEAQMNAMGAATQRATKQMSRSGMVTQQVGYQVGDFLVQVQSGTNAMVAFGQQATQLAGLLTGKFVALGAALGIAIPLVTALGGAWMRTRSETDDAEESLKTLEDRVRSLDQAVQDWLMTKEAASLGLTVDELIGTQSIEKAEEDIKRLRAEIEVLAEQMKAGELLGGAGTSFFYQLLGPDPEGELAQAMKALEAAEERLANLREKQAEERQKAFEEEQRQLENEIKLKEISSKFGEDSAEYLRLESQIRAENYALQVSQMDITEEQKKTLIEMNSELAEAERNTALIAGYHFDNIKDGAAYAETLARNMAGAAAAWARFEGAGGQTGPGSTTGPSPSSVMDLVEMPPAPRTPFRPYNYKPSGKSGGGGGSGGKNPLEQAKEYLEKLKREAELKDSLIGLSEEESFIKERTAEIVERLNSFEDGLGDRYDDRIQQIVDMEAETRRLQQAEEERARQMEQLEGHIESFVDSIVDGTTSIEDAFRQMLTNILQDLWNQRVSKPVSEGIGNFLAGLFADGAAFQSGSRIKAYADGGVVNSPTFFPMSGNQTGLMGEAGPEAIMPLKRGANGKLGVQMEGSSQTVQVTQNFNFQANGDESVKKIIAKEAPRLAQYAKQAVIEDRRRGGATKAAFG